MVHQHVAVHLQQRVDGRQAIAQAGQVRATRHTSHMRALLGVRQTDEERQQVAEEGDVVRP